MNFGKCKENPHAKAAREGISRLRDMTTSIDIKGGKDKETVCALIRRARQLLAQNMSGNNISSMLSEVDNILEEIGCITTGVRIDA